ncbi:uncharacterized protein LOC130969545 isoform X3 [Arachis stenosperma]|uniref:uncharacterized protein LOC130969545 isoform X3 n=1 Tax=Arachis stenosperma TaxID=217475 RepID=UPI0025AC67FD|nr:uncharacterized protein LOC130969545 isoform X3 [Arachis stenosperma]
MPQTPEKLRELMRLSFVRPARGVPTWFLADFIQQVMCTRCIDEKRELLEAILKGRKLSNLPKIQQNTLIIWGEQDQVFPLEFGHRLQRHIGESAHIVVIKNAGHAVNLEKSKEFARHLKSFLVGPKACSSSPHLVSVLDGQIQKAILDLTFTTILFLSMRRRCKKTTIIDTNYHTLQLSCSLFGAI